MDLSSIIWIRFGWWRNTNQWGNTNRSKYYLATSYVDEYSQARNLTLPSQARADLVNYVLDGTLPKPNLQFKTPTGLTSPIRSAEQMRYVNRITEVGNSIMRDNGISLQGATYRQNGSPENTTSAPSSVKRSPCPRF